MRERNEFLQRLNDAVAKYAMLNHPFYQLWSEGKLSQTTLSEYAKQYYAHVRAFPTYVSAVHSRCDDVVVRQMLLENLIEEERGENNHPELWIRFAEGLGVARDDVKSAGLLPSTVESVQTLKRLTQSEDYRAGMAALYAYESQIPEVAETKRDGLRKFYGIEDARAVSFFTVHETADVWHRQVEVAVLTKDEMTPDEQERVITAAEQAAHALWEFLDGVYAAYVNEN